MRPTFAALIAGDDQITSVGSFSKNSTLLDGILKYDVVAAPTIVETPTVATPPVLLCNLTQVAFPILVAAPAEAPYSLQFQLFLFFASLLYNT